MNKLSDELIAVTEPLINLSDDEGGHLMAVQKYKSLLLSASEYDPEKVEYQQNLYNHNGRAVSANTAVNCLDDYKRTWRFIAGAYQALRSLMQECQHTVRVLYAGTGPFAPILLPSMLRTVGKNVHFSLMDVNPATVDSLKSLLTTLDIPDAQYEILCADATQFEYKSGAGFDLIISETMQAALAREQQVPLFLNLMQQAGPTTLFIPESIKVYLGVRQVGDVTYQMTKSNCTTLEKVFEVSKEAMEGMLEERKAIVDFPESIICLDKETIQNSDLLLLMTEITVFDNLILGFQDSHLTVPLVIDNLAGKQDDSLKVVVQYKVGTEPAFYYDISSHERAC